MTEETPLGERSDSLIFMLSQLRDDLQDLIEGLETKALPHHVVVDGVRAQLRWVLKELSEG